MRHFHGHTFVTVYIILSRPRVEETVREVSPSCVCQQVSINSISYLPSPKVTFPCRLFTLCCKCGGKTTPTTGNDSTSFPSQTLWFITHSPIYRFVSIVVPIPQLFDYFEFKMVPFLPCTIYTVHSVFWGFYDKGSLTFFWFISLADVVRTLHRTLVPTGTTEFH